MARFPSGPTKRKCRRVHRVVSTCCAGSARMGKARVRSARPSALLTIPPKLARVLHDQGSRLRAFPAKEAIGFLAFIEDDEQSRAGGAEPAEAGIRRPRVH